MGDRVSCATMRKVFRSRMGAALAMIAAVMTLGVTGTARAALVDTVIYGREGDLAFRSAELALGERVPYRFGMNTQAPTLSAVALAGPLDTGGVVEFGPIFGSLIQAPLPPKPSASPLLGLTAKSVLPQPFVEAVIMPELPVRQFALVYGGVGLPVSQAIPQTQSGGVGVVTLRGTAIVAGSPLATPIPGAFWLFGSGVAALAGAGRFLSKAIHRLAPPFLSTKE